MPYGEGLKVLRNVGDGTFAPPISLGAGVDKGTFSVTPADLNGDGRIDLVLTYAGNSVSVLWNEGGGTFSPPASYAADVAPLSVTAADLDGDGRMDLAVAGSWYGSVSVLLHTCAP
ncbi:MAG: VCBS repeat-containing protein [Minicystis sp.]